MSQESTDRLQRMLEDMEAAPVQVRPSRYWEVLNRKNLDQLRESGYENFKRTIARNYFTWMIGTGDTQFRFLLSRVPAVTVLLDAVRALAGGRHELFTRKQSRRYNFLTQLLWSYALRQDTQGILGRLREPSEGNPPRVYRRGRLIAQDLANSALEYLSVAAGGADTAKIRTVMELGAGYGRNAFVFLSLMPGVRYRMVDIPPALYVAERYLSSVFAGRRIFRYRPFASYAQVREEVEAADIAFFLPGQIELLPADSVDLFVNISSLHEMSLAQIEYYFGQIDRLTRGMFYFKQWKTTLVPYENVQIREADYPVRPHWSRIYWRECAVQTRFFEALLMTRAAP